MSSDLLRTGLGELHRGLHTVSLPTAHNVKRWRSQTECKGSNVQALGLTHGFGDFRRLSRCQHRL